MSTKLSPFRGPLLFAFTLLTVSSADAQPVDADRIYQVSTLSALLEGDYEGLVPFARLRRLGDFGLGTFAALDGEMIAVDGHFYQVRDDGVAYPVQRGHKTPFAEVTFFAADRTVAIEESLSYAQLTERLGQMLPDPERYYAIRIDGAFAQLRVRSVPRQERPYPPLADALTDQVVFDYSDIAGTMVGFYQPAAAAGTGIPGFHFHFISADKTRGGHVLDCRSGELSVAIDDSQPLDVIQGKKPR